MQYGLKRSIPYKKLCYTVRQEFEPKETLQFKWRYLKKCKNGRQKSQILAQLVLN